MGATSWGSIPRYDICIRNSILHIEKCRMGSKILYAAFYLKLSGD